MRTCVALLAVLCACSSTADPPSSDDDSPSDDGRLEAIFAAYEARSTDDAEFQGYRVMPQTGAYPWPDGWHASDAVERIFDEGGWWPGRWELVSGAGPTIGVETMLDPEWAGEPEGDVWWIALGTVWEQDSYFTPLMREPHDTAPVAVLEAQSLRVGVPFPDEAALLEAFLDVVDSGSADAELLAEWVIDGPLEDDPAEQQAHQQVRDRIDDIGSDHPLWAAGVPTYVDPQLDEDLVDLLLGRNG